MEIDSLNSFHSLSLELFSIFICFNLNLLTGVLTKYKLSVTYLFTLQVYFQYFWAYILLAVYLHLPKMLEGFWFWRLVGFCLTFPYIFLCFFFFFFWSGKGLANIPAIGSYPVCRYHLLRTELLVCIFSFIPSLGDFPVFEDHFKS